MGDLNVACTAQFFGSFGIRSFTGCFRRRPPLPPFPKPFCVHAAGVAHGSAPTVASDETSDRASVATCNLARTRAMVHTGARLVPHDAGMASACLYAAAGIAPAVGLLFLSCFRDNAHGASKLGFGLGPSF